MLRLLFILLSASVGSAAPMTSFIEKHCAECHDGNVKKGGLDLTSLSFKPEERKNFEEWVKVFDRVSNGEMPPAKKPQPEAAAKGAFLKSVKEPLVAFNAADQAKSGRTVLRRLNRTEYENTVHDLLGIDTPLKQILPEDSSMDGFDTVAEGLRFSQLQIEKYLEAADAALDAAIVLTTKPERLNKRYSYKDEEGIRKNLDTPAGTLTKKNDPKSGHRVMFRETADEVIFFTTADYLVGLKQCRLPGTGTYRIKLSGQAFQTDGEPVTLMIYGNNFREKRLLTYFDLPADKRREYEFTTKLLRDEQIVINAQDIGRDAKGKNIYNEGAAEFKGRGIAVQWIEVEGPLSEEWPPPSLKLAVGDVPLKENPKNKRKYRDGKEISYEFAPEDPKQSLEASIGKFAARAFRRPLEEGETGRFIKLATDALDAGESFEDALRVGLRAVLTSPQFLLFEERPGKLSDYALASRVSYFLWSSMPDEELLKLAGDKKLSQPETLRAQTERLLKSPKAKAFVQNFVGQWLELRNIDATTPDVKLYPEFDALLKTAMITETESFFTELLQKNLSVTNFIKSDFAMLNRRLAEHYEIPGVNDESFRRVSLPADSPRGGLLSQASILKVTANGTTTSPVRRGAWVMKQLLGQPPAPPPANVGGIEPDTRGATTIREQLAKHRTSDTCNSCHRNIDPPGFALESFDVIGGWRETYRSQDKGSNTKRKLNGQNVWQYKEGLPVDASGELADGQKFAGYKEFQQLLLAQQDRVTRSLAQNLLVYATGAGIQFADRDEVQSVVNQVKADGNGLRSLVHRVVESAMFGRK